MDINNLISKLLLVQDCVIIPDLGGFISNYHPAQADFRTNHFSPPSREIVFNAQLSKNDGLLINFVSDETGCSYIEAMKMVRQFSDNCLSKLDSGKKIYINRIGFLYQGGEQNIQFEPELSENLLLDSYGLVSFEFPEIGQRPSSKAGKSRDMKSDHPRTRKGTWKWIAAGIPLLVGVCAFSLYMNNNLKLEFSEIIPTQVLNTFSTPQKTDQINTSIPLQPLSASSKDVAENSSIQPSYEENQSDSTNNTVGTSTELQAQTQVVKDKKQTAPSSKTVAPVAKKQLPESKTPVAVKTKPASATVSSPKKQVAPQTKAVVVPVNKKDKAKQISLAKPISKTAIAPKAKLAAEDKAVVEPTAGSGLRYHLVVGCFKSMKNVKIYQDQLKAKGYKSQV
ncbi:MAG: hypothetical protein Q8859_14025, partial [Bacteroidota bacterium]|nr:hypothetical protein [Bacteroidota bacterium]